jgi:hypothetical protein
MKTNFVKTSINNLLLAIVIMVLPYCADAQKDNQNSPKPEITTTDQQDQPVQQQNQNEIKGRQNYKQHQQQGDQHKNIEAQRVAYITKEVDLTPDEAKVFWPVYNEYESRRHELRKSFRNSDDFHKIDFDKLTEKEATQMLDNQIIEAQRYLDLRKEYHAKFKAVLPAVKVLKLYDAEREFQKMLIDKLRQHNKASPPQSEKK